MIKLDRETFKSQLLQSVSLLQDAIPSRQFQNLTQLIKNSCNSNLNSEEMISALEKIPTKAQEILGHQLPGFIRKPIEVYIEQNRPVYVPQVINQNISSRTNLEAQIKNLEEQIQGMQLVVSQPQQSPLKHLPPNELQHFVNSYTRKLPGYIQKLQNLKEEFQRTSSNMNINDARRVPIPLITGSTTSNAPTPLSLNTKTATITADQQQSFSNYILGGNSSANKKELLKHTILKNPLQNKTFTYDHVTMSSNAFNHLLGECVDPNSFLTGQWCKGTDAWYDFNDPQSYWINAANATQMGGGYRGRGSLLEEMLFFQFPDLARLDFVTRNHPIHPCEGGYGYPPSADATPWIAENLTREFSVHQSLYARQLENTPIQVIPQKVRASQSPPIHIIGIAARDWGRGTNRKYSYADLVYHLKCLHLAFTGAKLVHQKNQQRDLPTIHTTAWGCGGFNNSEKMITALQLLAARMAGVPIVFHGLSNSHNPNYTSEILGHLQSWVDGQILLGKTPAQILQILVDCQDSDRSFAPKDVS